MKNKKMPLKKVIYNCIKDILEEEKKEYATLKEIYQRVSTYLEEDNNYLLQSKIRGRLQECCKQYSSFLGEELFLTERVRSGNWKIKKNDSCVKWVKYKNNNFLISNDGWENVELVKSIHSDYVLETNEDNAYKAKLMQMVGKEKAHIIIDELNNIRKLLRKIKNINKENDGYGSAFEVFAISVLHNISYEDCIANYIINGDLDGKIDAIYYGDPDNFYIYQIKLKELSDVAYEEMAVNYEKCIKNEQPKYGKDLYEFIIAHKDKFEDKKQVIRSVSESSDKKLNYKPLYIYNQFFENKILGTETNNMVLSIYKPTIFNNEQHQYNVSSDGRGNFCFYINADKLIKSLVSALGMDPNSYDKNLLDLSKYFFDNVRGTLPVNQQMVYTIENEPENFIKYNNGINITGEVKDLNNKLLIKKPVINNGQQTITTLIKSGKNLDKITVQVKIINESDTNVKSKISRFSNEQEKIKSIDLLSLNKYVRDIQKQIFDTNNKEKYFLKIYSSGQKEFDQIITILYEKNNIIELIDFIKLYFSVQNGKELGAWKNASNIQIEKTIIETPFDIDLSLKVCQVISKFISYIDGIENKKQKDDLKSSDLAFKYLMCKENLKEDEARKIIDNINQNYYYNKKGEKSKLIDIYKSTTIINKIEDELKKFKVKA